MGERSTEPLQILVANESEGRTVFLRDAVASLGHDVVVTTTDVAAVAALTADLIPDVALVGVSGDSPDALRLIEQIVKEAACPVIALLPRQDARLVNEAARRGVFAYLVDDGPDELQGALDIVLRRFAEYHALEGAFARRAVTERAKGILMERHGLDEVAAFERLREHARHRGRRLVDVAQAVCDTQGLTKASGNADAAAKLRELDAS
jgi:response regulator NasT